MRPIFFVQKIKIFFVFCTKNHNFATDMSKINPYEELIRKERLATGNIESVKQDVFRFLRADPHELDIWSNDYFLKLADMIVFK